MIRLEFHTHTIFSPDSLTPPERLLEACRRKGIDRVVVTDHNTIRGALAARKLAPEMVIVGEEIMTTRGELLAAFVREEVPAGLEPAEAIARLRDQAAFISVSHPFDHFRGGSWRLEDLKAIAGLVDAVEVFNSRCLDPRFNRRADEFADAHDLLKTAGSDAHGTNEIGRSTIRLEDFQDASALRESLKKAALDTRLSPPWVMGISRYAKIIKAWGKIVKS
ncbi:MAG TPA: PHP-associated domain-containing protein [Anaerolineales bacterium]|nr:PHP-associated domain-containing protein [Anaerolineales bacterium]